MEDTVITSLLGAGPMGVIVVALGFWVRRLTHKLEGAQKSRVADAHKVAETMIELNDKWAKVQVDQTKAILGLKSAYESLQTTLTAPPTTRRRS